MRGEKMDPPRLEHPLPEEIQKMTRDETVCKFCGVSYLIHNEIKALEDKLRAAEEELVFYRSMEGREEKLQQRIVQLEQDIDKLKQDIVSKDEILDTLRNDLSSRDQDIEKMKTDKLDADKHIAEVTHRCEQLRLKHTLFRNNLPSIVKQLQEHKTESSSIKNLVTAQNTVLREDCRMFQDKILTVMQAKLSDVNRLQERLTQLEHSTESHQQLEDQLKSQLEQAQLQISQLSPAAAQTQQLQGETEQLANRVAYLETKLGDATTQNRSLIMENDQYVEQMKRHSHDIESLNNKNRQKDKELLDQVRKFSQLQLEMNERDNELQTLRQDIGKMSQENEEQKEKFRRTSTMSTSQTEDLKDAVHKLSRDMDALKKEREMMITAHQNQIEQLRESFKARILEADKWPQRMEETLRKERQQHTAALQALEEKLRESFIMELQIEKQKHQELLQKYHNDTRVDEKQVKSQLDGLHSEYKSEISDLHKQLAEYKARARTTENNLRDEVANLKKIIKDLEDRLARVDNTAGSEVSQLKSQLHATRSDLDQVKRDCVKYEKENASAKEEILFLQETVRKECEERFELTEALSLAKEDLLAYKKPQGGYAPQQAWAGSSRSGSAASSLKTEPAKTAAVPSSSSVSSSRSEEIAIFKKLASNRPQPPSQPKDSVSDRTERESVNQNNLGYEGQKSNRTPGRGVKGASLSESRRRISNMLGRR